MVRGADGRPPRVLCKRAKTGVLGLARGLPSRRGMTAPRRVVPGTRYLLTRRSSERRFFLRPSRTVNHILRYVLAVATQRYGVALHAFCVLSTHLHLVLTDVKGNLPEFERYLHSLIARSINALHGHFESFWAPGSYSAVALLASEDVVSKCAYVLCNPTTAGLVRRGSGMARPVVGSGEDRRWSGSREATQALLP